ncbi:hypothetical protein MDAP_000891 [Mitosporidium daphniae]|uniref:DUF1014-domain-containing protein n=1 Tax=Mitosporidium daphniae TaxID=1485682 RepID=A0A098VPD9_9MICR|nr:uncharacterized protein DI09_5p360 [Mitosporidium daphniae]KGG50689.1 hypothetical protein DI09_5p360 [Mitosporidium daphniae]|eukprot:XP_013237116.1 uncharacterized protein DI09_5p360 [Mitosporidium daphniae]
MAKKFGENQKKQQGRENKQKALGLKHKQTLDEKNRKEEESWKQGVKDTSKQEAERLKMEEKKARKKERESLLLEEEVLELPNTSFRTAPAKKAMASPAPIRKDTSQTESVYSASSVDDALELLATIKSSRSSIASSVERHPERRMKAAFAAFEERELPILKAEYPYFRLSQLQEMLRKKFAKSDENPLNQPHVSYEATPDEVRKLASQIQESKLDSFKSNH